MSELANIKKQYKILFKRWTNTVDLCGAEGENIWNKKVPIKKEFLEIFSNYAQNKIKFQKKFLKISQQFGVILQEEEKMQDEWSQLLNPFEIKINKLMKKIEQLEESK